MREDRRPVLVGMNNPLSADPEYALAPFPTNCTGWRLWKMMSDAAEADGLPAVRRQQYMDDFRRVNVLNGRAWNAAEARVGAAALAPSLADRIVIVVGVATLKALRLPRPTEWCQWIESSPQDRGGLLFGGGDVDPTFRYTLIPHASGLCHEYNDPAMRLRVGRLLLDVATEATTDVEPGTLQRVRS